MKIKICGVKFPGNLTALNSLQPDYLGFIFYAPSLRYMAETLQPRQIVSDAKKVGVFVNADLTAVEKTIRDYNLDAVQLHGNETPEYCDHFYSRGIEVIKAFSIHEAFHFEDLNPYKRCCRFFLFDAKGEKPGGNGISFNWQCLQQYDQAIPFFLSGGIAPGNVSEVLAMKDYNLYGIDINSGIEDAPGVKNISKAKQVIATIKKHYHEI